MDNRSLGRRSRSHQGESYNSSRRRRKLIRWIVLIVAAILAITVYRLIRTTASGRSISAVSLPCTATQYVTPFGSSVLYYDGSSIHCLNGTGGVRWSYPVGINAHFSVSDTHLAVWNGTQLYIINQDGISTYNESLSEEIQFVRVSKRYCAIVVGSQTRPDLLVRSLDGTLVDQESDAYRNLLLLDVGFFGSSDEYMWTLAMDINSTAVNTVLNTFQVGKMNTGEVDLGEFLSYAVVSENTSLHVFTTQQMYTYDYKAVQKLSGTQLVYGWQLIDSWMPQGATGEMLLAQTSDLGSSPNISKLRVLAGSLDRQYTLPASCVGAGIQKGNIYAVSPEYIYRARYENSMSELRFYPYEIPIPMDMEVTDYIGLTTDGQAIVACGDEVWSITLPR